MAGADDMAASPVPPTWCGGGRGRRGLREGWASWPLTCLWYPSPSCRCCGLSIPPPAGCSEHVSCAGRKKKRSASSSRSCFVPPSVSARRRTAAAEPPTEPRARCESETYLTMSSAILSGNFPTLVPPNFWTIQPFGLEFLKSVEPMAEDGFCCLESHKGAVCVGVCE